MKTSKIAMTALGALMALSFSQAALGHGDTSMEDSTSAPKQTSKTKMKKKTTINNKDGSKEVQKSESSTYNSDTSRSATIDDDHDHDSDQKAPDSEYYHQ